MAERAHIQGIEAMITEGVAGRKLYRKAGDRRTSRIKADTDTGERTVYPFSLPESSKDAILTPLI